MINPSVARALFLILVLVFSGRAFAVEHKVACNSLPSAVQQESKTFLGGGTTLRGCVKDVSAGETTYEVELLTSTGSKDVTFSATGDVLEIEQEVQESALPPVVAAAFEKAARGGALGKIESLTRKGQLAGYESTISQGGKRREVAFRPDGSAMKAD